MKEELSNLKNQALAEIEQAADAEGLLDMEKKYLGRQDGELTAILKSLKDLSAAEKPIIGKLANAIKAEIEGKLASKESELKSARKSGTEERFDETLPGRALERGHLHPISQIRREVEDIFLSMGFDIFDSPELENDYYCFESLNIPADHPARDAWDTFYVKGEKPSTDPQLNARGPESADRPPKLLLRPHTSAAQVRYMETHEPPFKVIVPGKCFRREATDASHEHTFYQVEGFVVGENISIANLIATQKALLSSIFGYEAKVRLRPGYFPFVEPGFELDCSCAICQGKGCNVCKHSGWIELIPCGMIHPKVFEHAGYPPGKYTGFAFGMGLDRLVMMRYGINEIRLFHGGDLRFIRQF